ncbi:MAG: MFS transporter [Clostridia bacterium]|nr:MFS transporter [Clostridia bacterium]
MTGNKKGELNTSLIIACIALFSYSASYFARNVLAVVQVEMMDKGVFTGEQIGLIISVAMFVYAIAQLVTGVLGDFIKSKYMISGGLLLAGLSTLVIPYSRNLTVVIIAYSLSNIFLSPIFGSVTKTIAENVVPRHASRVALPVSFATVFGGPLAGALALIFAWDFVFLISGVTLIVLGIGCYILFTVCERKGYITYRPRVKPAEREKKKLDFKPLLRHSIISFMVIAVLVGVNNSINQLLIRYFTEFLGVENDTAKALYTVIGFIGVAAPFFFNLFLYEVVFKRDVKKTLLSIFVVAAASFFLCAAFPQYTTLNLILMTVAKLACGGYGAILFSVYCPSLKRVGAVSSISSIINCTNYAIAALATAVITAILSSVGWQAIVIAWGVLMLGGLGATLAIRSGKLEGTTEAPTEPKE